VLVDNFVPLVLGRFTNTPLFAGVHNFVVGIHHVWQLALEGLKLVIVDNNEQVGEHLRLIWLNHTIYGWLTLVDLICEISGLKRTSVLLSHRLDLGLHLVVFFHVLTDVLILLEHLLLDGDSQLVQ